VLQNDYQQASVWLNELARLNLDADYRAIADFYKLWIALVRKEAGVKEDFDHLRQSLTAYTQLQKKPDPQPSAWSFQAAQHALARTELSPQKQKLLSDAMVVIDDPTKDVATIQPPSEM